MYVSVQSKDDYKSSAVNFIEVICWIKKSFYFWTHPTSFPSHLNTVHPSPAEWASSSLSLYPADADVLNLKQRTSEGRDRTNPTRTPPMDSFKSINFKLFFNQDYKHSENLIKTSESVYHACTFTSNRYTDLLPQYADTRTLEFRILKTGPLRAKGYWVKCQHTNVFIVF